MKSIAFFNNKGGVGKTTLLCNLAANFSIKRKLRILVIDADPQSNATTYLLSENELSTIFEDGSFLNLFEYYEPVAKGRGYSTSHPSITKSERFNVDLMPGDPRFALREDLLAKDWGDTLVGDDRGLQTTFAFKHLLTSVNDNYDFAFIDMGPSLGAINRSILLAADFFLTPMSADLFSLMAVNNIILSLKRWREGLEAGLEFYKKNNSKPYEMDGVEVKWKIIFLGYVMQQYIRKSVRGEARAVKSYEQIIRQFPSDMEKIELQFGLNDTPSAVLGNIPSLYSLVPMSQTAHAPIFSLGSADGVVGAHFAKVDESAIIFNEIAKNVLLRVALAEKAK